MSGSFNAKTPRRKDAKVLKVVLLIVLNACVLTGCAPLRQYRTSYEACQVEEISDRDGNEGGSRSLARATNDCTLAAIEETPDYLLGLVEFDDRGWLWDTNQMRAVLGRLCQEDAKNGLLIVVFAHGWKHNASFDDDNVEAFRMVLSELQQIERTNSLVRKAAPARRVVGVYLGWRGLSQQLWGVKELSFWERKRAAHMVGQGGVSELLLELDSLRKASHFLHRDEPRRDRQQTMLVVIGHSFGGAVIFSSLASIIEERLIDTLDSSGRARPPRAFGDLVILINPAFEAARFQVLKQTADDRTYFTNQPPILTVFTSKGDKATKYAFPAGRFISTLLGRYRDSNQRRSDRTAVGHYQPYVTHDLRARARNPALPKPARGKKTRRQEQSQATQYSIGESAARVWEVQDQIDANRDKLKGQVTIADATFRFSHAELIPRQGHRLFNPIYVVAVDRKIIPNHSDIYRDEFLTFLREFILAIPSNR